MNINFYRNWSPTDVLNVKFMKEKLPILKKIVPIFKQLMVEHYVYCWCIEIRISHVVEGIELHTKYLVFNIKWPIEMLVFCLTKSIKPKTTNCIFFCFVFICDERFDKLQTTWKKKLLFQQIQDSVLFSFRGTFGSNSMRIRDWVSGNI